MPVEPRPKTLVRQFSTLLTERQDHRLRPTEGGFENQRRRQAEEVPECIEGPVAYLGSFGWGQKLRAKPESRVRSARDSRAKPEI